MKRFLRMFKYVRELEEDLAKAHLSIARLESRNLEETIPAHIDSGLATYAEQGAWINYQCKRRQVKHEEIARSAGVSRQMVQQVIYGKRTSARIQKQIATSLGYDSWMELLAARKEVAA